MFRIKTDIRQYNCESREKVERLIRNWVIRPTDLIFDDDKQEWGPIGEHSAFVSTFAELAKQETEAADTLVSEETPPVARRGEEEGQDLDPPEPPEGVEPESASPDEITVMTEETVETVLDDEEAESDGDISVVETREESGGRQEATAAAEAEPDEQLDPEATQPDVPESTPGPADDEGGGEPGGTEETEPEATSIDGREFEAKSSSDGGETVDEDEETEPEATSIDGREFAPEADHEKGGEESEPNDEEELRDTDEVEDEEPSRRAPSGRHDGVDPAGTLRGETAESIGRHDLPEEIFATNEINESADEEAEPAIDDLEGGNAGGAGDSEEAPYVEVEEALQENVRQARRQEHVDDEWDEILDRLRETDELSKEELEEITETRDEIAIGRDEGDEPLEDDELPDEIEEYVSEGYQKTLAIEVGPSRRDVQLGLRRSEASEADKDRVFPYPGPKKKGVVQREIYHLRAPSDHSLKVVVGVIGVVVLSITLAVLLF